MIKEAVQPILDQYAMGIIQKITLEKVAFGNRAPQIMGTLLASFAEFACQRYLPRICDQLVRLVQGLGLLRD